MLIRFNYGLTGDTIGHSPATKDGDRRRQSLLPLIGSQHGNEEQMGWSGSGASGACSRFIMERLRCRCSPSTRDVSSVTFAAFRRPAGRFRPIFSSFSLSDRPPFFDLALQTTSDEIKIVSHSSCSLQTHRLKTPPSSEAFRHSGGDSRRCTSPTVTLYLDVELRSDRRPGTEQNTSVGEASPVMTISLLSLFRGLIPVVVRPVRTRVSGPHHSPFAIPFLITPLWSPPNKLFVSWST